MKKGTVIYQGKSGEIAFTGDLKKETIWATQAQISEVFGVDRSVVAKHIKNIFSDEELNEKVVCAKFAQTTSHGALKGKTQTKEVLFYNLDIVLAVGYRTNSSVAIKFRQWATKTLRAYITEGFVIHPSTLTSNATDILISVCQSATLVSQIKTVKRSVEASPQTRVSVTLLCTSIDRQAPSLVK